MRAAGSIIGGGAGTRSCSSSGAGRAQAQQQHPTSSILSICPRAAACPPQQLRPEALADAWCQSASLRRSARSCFRLPAFQNPGYNIATSQPPTMGGYSRSPPQQDYSTRPPAPGGGGGFPAPPQQQQQQAPPQQQPPQPPQQQQQQPGPPSPSPTATSLVSASSVDGGAGTALKAKEAPKTVQVRFWLKFHVDYGQTIRIIGGHEATGAWNLAKAPFLRWSEGDLWNVTLELAGGGVYEYKYVVVESDGVTAASWQRGANNVLALQMNDEEVEVYDNWKNAPGALCVVDGQEITRERKLLAWAGDMAVQRGELRRTRMELAQAREEIRVLRAELSVLRMEVSEANIARAAAEARQVELERANSALRMEVTSSQASARNTMEEAVRLLTDLSAEEDITGGDPSGSSYTTHASLDPSAGGSGQQQHQHNGSSGGGGGGGMFGGLFNGFGMPGSSSSSSSSSSNGAGAGDAATSSPGGRAASVVAAAAAAMAAAAGPQEGAADGSSSDGGYGSGSDSDNGGGGRFSAYINRTRQGN